MPTPNANLVRTLCDTQRYVDLAMKASGPERECYKRIVELHLNIARELEHLARRDIAKSHSRRSVGANRSAKVST
jgi:hypothetical protein